MTLLTDYDLNMAWLNDADNKRKYNGEWVVLSVGKLIAHGRNYVELYRKYGAVVGDSALIIRVPASHWLDRKRKWEGTPE